MSSRLARRTLATPSWNWSGVSGARHSGTCPTIKIRWRPWRAATASPNWPQRWRRDGSGQQFHRGDSFLLQPIERALLRRFVRSPAQDGSAVAKPLAAEMIVGYLD